MSANLCRASRHRSPVLAPVLSSSRRPRLPVPFPRPEPPEAERVGQARPAVELRVELVLQARPVVARELRVPVELVLRVVPGDRSELVHPSQVQGPRLAVCRSLRADPVRSAAPRPQWWIPQPRRSPVEPVTVRPSLMRPRMSVKVVLPAVVVRPAVEKVVVYPAER
jgi:hypothetical protein